jgi:hypothetical protein
MRDGLSNIQISRGANQTLSGATPNNSRAFDIQGFGSASFYLGTNTSTAAGTDGFTMKLQHSDTLVGADFADVPAALVRGTAPVSTDNADDDIIIPGGLGYLGKKRYVRAVVTGSANTNAVVQVWCLRGRPHRAPVAPTGLSLATT